MKIKKTVTEKVIAANRANSQKSTGPHNFEAVKENAVKHGLLARRIVFNNEEEELEFNSLFEALCNEYQPSGPTLFMLVEEAATCIWKLRIANRWESQELANRENAAAFTRALAENHYEQQLPLFTRGDGSNSAVQLGGVCEELVIQSGSRNSELNYGHYSKDRDKKDKAGHVIIQAKLGSGLKNQYDRMDSAWSHWQFKTISFNFFLSSSEPLCAAAASSRRAWSQLFCTPSPVAYIRERITAACVFCLATDFHNHCAAIALSLGTPCPSR